MFLCLTFPSLNSSSVTSFCHSVDVSSQHSSSRVHVTSWSLISVVGRQGRPQTLQSSCCERCWQVDSSWMLPADPPWCSGEVRCWRGRWLSVCWGPLPASREYLFFCRVKTSENEVSQRQQHYLYSLLWMCLTRNNKRDHISKSGEFRLCHCIYKYTKTTSRTN